MTLEDLAEIMHSKLCRWNHTDGCTWLYEEDGAPMDTAHQVWLVKARNVVADTGLPIEDIARVFKVIV